MNTAFEALRGVKGLPSELRMASKDDPLFHQGYGDVANDHPFLICSNDFVEQ